MRDLNRTSGRSFLERIMALVVRIREAALYLSRFGSVGGESRTQIIVDRSVESEYRARVARNGEIFV